MTLGSLSPSRFARRFGPLVFIESQAAARLLRPAPDVILANSTRADDAAVEPAVPVIFIAGSQRPRGSQRRMNSSCATMVLIGVAALGHRSIVPKMAERLIGRTAQYDAAGFVPAAQQTPQLKARRVFRLAQCVR